MRRKARGSAGPGGDAAQHHLTGRQAGRGGVGVHGTECWGPERTAGLAGERGAQRTPPPPPHTHPITPPPTPTCSAARPPSAMAIMSSICWVVISRFSLGRYWAKPRAALPRGTIDTWGGARAGEGGGGGRRGACAWVQRGGELVGVRVGDIVRTWAAHPPTACPPTHPPTPHSFTQHSLSPQPPTHPPTPHPSTQHSLSPQPPTHPTTHPPTHTHPHTHTHLEQGLCVFEEPTHHRVPSLVVGHGAPLLHRDDLRVHVGVGGRCG